MPKLSPEDIWMTSQPPEAVQGAAEDSWPTETAFLSRPDTMSARVVVGSLLSMGALGAGALISMHSLAHSGDPWTSSRGAAAMQATAAPIAAPAQVPIAAPAEVAIAAPTRVSSTAWTPTSFPTPTPAATASGTSSAPRIAMSTPAAAAARRARPAAKPPLRVTICPSPVPTPTTPIRGAQPIRGAPATEAPPEQASGEDPFDDAPTSPTASAGLARFVGP
jgi:hypothetical protein